MNHQTPEVTKVRSQKEETITLEDLEKRLAASTLSLEPDTGTIDPTQLLSINLSAKYSQESIEKKHQYTENNQDCTDNNSTTELPTAFRDIDVEADLSVGKYFARTNSSSDIEIDSDFEPIPFDKSIYNIEDGGTFDSLQNLKEYEHLFDETYLQEIVDFIIDGEEIAEPEPVDLIEAFDNFNIKNKTSGPAESDYSVKGGAQDLDQAKLKAASLAIKENLFPFCTPCDENVFAFDENCEEAAETELIDLIEALAAQDLFQEKSKSTSFVPEENLPPFCIPCNEDEEEIFDFQEQSTDFQDKEETQDRQDFQDKEDSALVSLRIEETQDRQESDYSVKGGAQDLDQAKLKAASLAITENLFPLCIPCDENVFAFDENCEETAETELTDLIEAFAAQEDIFDFQEQSTDIEDKEEIQDREDFQEKEDLALVSHRTEETQDRQDFQDKEDSAQVSHGLGQTLYCLPCEKVEEDPLDNSINSTAVDYLDLKEAAELEFDKEDKNLSVSEEELQGLIDNVMHQENPPQSQEMSADSISDRNGRSSHQQVIYEVSKRPEALREAEPLINGFYDGKNEKQCFGHKETIFGLAMSPCGNYCATASQDSTICVWNVEKNRLLSTLKGSPDHECLRVAWASEKWCALLDRDDEEEKDASGQRNLILAMSGADGVASIWKSNDAGYNWKKIKSLDHVTRSQHEESESLEGNITNITENGEQQSEKKKNEGTEIYSLQFIDEWHGLPSGNSGASQSVGILVTSSEDFIHIWQYSQDCNLTRSDPDIDENVTNDDFSVTKVMDIKFTHMEHGYGGVFVHLNDESNEFPEWTKAQKSNIIVDKKVFGGQRNPDKLVYVFDAVQCSANGLLGVALSDGTTRLVNGRGVCVTILQLPGCQSHLTSLSWDKSGSRLASCVATGHVVLWDLDNSGPEGGIQPVCRAVLEGGHDQGRPLFGASFFGGNNEDLILSWGVDGKLCLWDSYSQGQIGAPICVLVTKDDYPIYAVDLYESGHGQSDDENSPNAVKSTIGLAGGSEGGFIGVPISLYHF